jgi:hypothetical protein
MLPPLLLLPLLSPLPLLLLVLLLLLVMPRKVKLLRKKKARNNIRVTTRENKIPCLCGGFFCFFKFDLCIYSTCRLMFFGMYVRVIKVF